MESAVDNVDSTVYGFQLPYFFVSRLNLTPFLLKTVKEGKAARGFSWLSAAFTFDHLTSNNPIKQLNLAYYAHQNLTRNSISFPSAFSLFSSPLLLCSPSSPSFRVYSAAAESSLWCGCVSFVRSVKWNESCFMGPLASTCAHSLRN